MAAPGNPTFPDATENSPATWRRPPGFRLIAPDRCRRMVPPRAGCERGRMQGVFDGRDAMDSTATAHPDMILRWRLARGGSRELQHGSCRVDSPRSAVCEGSRAVPRLHSVPDWDSDGSVITCLRPCSATFPPDGRAHATLPRSVDIDGKFIRGVPPFFKRTPSSKDRCPCQDASAACRCSVARAPVFLRRGRAST
jgi:hypothetical protein